MYKTAVYACANGNMQKVTHLKTAKIILLKQHFASVNVLLK